MKLPPSCTSLPINLVGLTAFLTTLFTLAAFQPDWSNTIQVTLLLLALCLPIIVLEFFFRRPPLLQEKKAPLFDGKRVGTKLLALYTIYGMIAFVYWVFPEYQGQFYAPFFEILVQALPFLLLFSFPYLIFVDRRMKEPEDAYYAFGNFLLGVGITKGKKIIQLFLGWLVKLFFLPLMFIYFSQNIDFLTEGNFSWKTVTQDFRSFFDYSWSLLFTIDLAFVTVGYILTLQIFDSYIRSTEPHFLGWFVALICYQPFWGQISNMYFAYDADGFVWGDWLMNSEILYILWGSTILILLTVYALASVTFGIRFSNLTNRGILTNGPYRYLKHPAYVSKNLSWWLVSIPFLSQTGDISVIIQSCCLLLFVNLVYFLRAKTEEKHLLADPIYQRYFEWMKKKSLWARFKSRVFL